MKKLSLILVLLLLSSTTLANDYLKSWIPATCCVTNNCCWEISNKEVMEVNQDEVVVLATGQRLKKQYSPDGKYYRCACDFRGGDNWEVHDKANTRCVFVPQPSS